VVLLVAVSTGARADRTFPDPVASAPPDAVVESIADRILWLATRMIHEANTVRPNEDGLKVGGHQASSASVVSILAALYLRWLRRDDLVSVKPHAGPAYHATQYLLGGLDERYLTSLRAFGGLQSYPSRTKDPDRVDFSTGSVGLGAVAPLYAALADRYLELHATDRTADRPARRFVSIVGDAELDEGNVWESAIEESLRGIGNFTMIVDLNRQSLDRVVPGIRIHQLAGMFAAAGWQVLEAKYGRRLRRLIAGPGGEALQRRIDEMSNEDYQVLIRRDGPVARERLVGGASPADRDVLATLIADVPDAELPATLADLGGHDIDGLVRILDAADADRSRPSIIFAYTIKGWRLPFAGDALNHSAMLSADQIADLGTRLGADPSRPWERFAPGTPEARLCAERGAVLEAGAGPDRPAARTIGGPLPAIDIRVGGRASTQQAFGDALVALSRDAASGARVVTASPDVAVSTSLGGWINRVGVFALDAADVVDDTPRALTWSPKPTGQHIELGISEMNLFMLLSQFGLTAELFGEPLVPVGTVYDPFICRGLDALVYASYIRSRFLLVGTPAGVTLAPEGGAHQSAITPSIGIELPGLRSYEPAFAQETAWLVGEAIRGILDPSADFSTYLRLSTRAIDQALADEVRQRFGPDEWRRQVIAGGYRLIESGAAPSLPAGAPVVNVVAMGSVVTEAAEAVRFLIDEEVAANLIVVSSAERLAAEVHRRRLTAIRDHVGDGPGHLETLFPAAHRRAPMVTVLDGASHALSFIGSVFGAPVVPLGVDTFGQSGTIPDLYAYAGIDASHIVDAALLAIEIG
jgi:pyruvate dehydrogenase E1 component